MLTLHQAQFIDSVARLPFLGEDLPGLAFSEDLTVEDDLESRHETTMKIWRVKPGVIVPANIDYEDYRSNYLEQVTQPAWLCTYKGTNVPFVIAKPRFRQLQKGLAPYGVLPGHIVALLPELPNLNHLEQVELHSEPSEFDEYEKSNRSDDIGSFDAVGSAKSPGTVRIFATADYLDLRRILKHEYAHLMLKGNWLHLFRQAALLESDGHFMTRYSRRNQSENWAVHFGEYFLAGKQHFLSFIDEAPIRALAMAAVLKEALATVQAGWGSNQHSAYAARVEYVEAQVLPEVCDLFESGFRQQDYSTVKQQLNFVRYLAGARVACAWVKTIVDSQLLMNYARIAMQDRRGRFGYLAPALYTLAKIDESDTTRAFIQEIAGSDNRIAMCIAESCLEETYVVRLPPRKPGRRAY